MSFTGIIKNCRDSHVHWLATGQSNLRLNLRNLTVPQDVSQLKIRQEYFRSDWLIGFGWDDNQWASQGLPTRFILDEVFPNFPVAFSRADGHALWVNSEALRLSGLLDSRKDFAGGKVVRDESGAPTGVLIDLACEPVFALIPEASPNLIRDSLMAGMSIFNRAGFTHIRDMTCNSHQWGHEVDLDRSSLLTMAVEQYFNVGEPTAFSEPLQLAISAAKERLQNIRVSGLKVYFDGALGSEGALLSKCYCGKDHKGLQIMTCELLAEIMTKTWESNLDLAVHAIGDQAAHLVVSTALAVWSKRDVGTLHIEHAEVVRPETIQMMRGRRIKCHMQPCHFLSDKVFLKNKIGELFPFIFPFESLRKNNVDFDFGSDSPIESPSIVDNIKALKLLNGGELEVEHLQSHPDLNWMRDTWTEFVNGNPAKIFFRGKELTIN